MAHFSRYFGQDRDQRENLRNRKRNAERRAASFSSTVSHRFWQPKGRTCNVVPRIPSENFPISLRGNPWKNIGIERSIFVRQLDFQLVFGGSSWWKWTATAVFPGGSTDEEPKTLQKRKIALRIQKNIEPTPPHWHIHTHLNAQKKKHQGWASKKPAEVYHLERMDGTFFPCIGLS